MKKLLLAIALALMAGSARAFDPILISGAVWLVQAVGLPVSYALSCGLAYSPPVRIFGTEESVYGLDWGSLACHARKVYGMQLCLCGGAVESRMYGLQLGILATGYAMEELPFGDYHFFDLDSCRMYGLQFGTFAAKTARANGLQLSAIYTEAQTVNGVQIGLVNRTGTLHGLQVGLYNSAAGGCGLQIGGLNCTESGLAGCLPVLNFAF